MRDRGFDPVLNERGSVPYKSDESLEESCYKEIDLCDIVVSIIGGRLGTVSRDSAYSISQNELKRALEHGKPVYVFVEKDVLSEHPTYKANKDLAGFQCVAVDDVRIYQFLDEISALPQNNPIMPFETSADIIEYLREQWAGLFQRLLQQSGRQKEVDVIASLKSISGTLNQLVNYITEEKTKGDKAIRDILSNNHPSFDELRSKLRVPYRVFFTNLQEFKDWITNRRFEEVPSDQWVSPDVHEWLAKGNKKHTLLKVHSKVFDKDGTLIPALPGRWDSSLMDVSEIDAEPQPSPSDDIPF